MKLTLEGTYIFYLMTHNFDNLTKDIHAWDKYKMPYYSKIRDNGYVCDKWELKGLSSPNYWELGKTNILIEDGYIILEYNRYLINDSIKEILNKILETDKKYPGRLVEEK